MKSPPWRLRKLLCIAIAALPYDALVYASPAPTNGGGGDDNVA